MLIENPKIVRIKEILTHCESELAGQVYIYTRRIPELPYAFRRSIADVLMDEFLRAGMTPEHDENEYGLEIEALIDSLELARRF